MTALYLQVFDLKQIIGGGGGNRTRVRKSATDSSTYLALSFDLTQPTRTHTLRSGESPKFNFQPSNPTKSDSL